MTLTVEDRIVVVLGATLGAPIALVLVLFRKFRRIAALSIVCFVGLVILGATMMSMRLDREAIAAGYRGSVDKKLAIAEGFDSAAAWDKQRDTVLARQKEEARQRTAAEAAVAAQKRVADAAAAVQSKEDCFQDVTAGQRSTSVTRA